MILVIIAVLIVIFILVSKKKQDGKNLSSFEKNVKDIGDKIVEGIDNITSTTVNKCPNCGASVTKSFQQNCEYCGSKLPRKSRFK